MCAPESFRAIDAFMRSAGNAHSINGSAGNKPQQQSQQLDGAGPDISLFPEELQEIWHENLNRGVCPNLLCCTGKDWNFQLVMPVLHMVL